MGVPDIPSVSSCLLLAARQSLHTPSLSREIPAVPKVGMVQKRGVPGTPTHTLRAGPRLVICLHMAGFTWVTHLPQGHMVEGGEVQEGSQGSHVTSPMLSVPSLGQEPPLVLRHLGPWWPHQMRGVGCAPT